ncbi:MAG: type I secretion system permease/ATPase [Hyphomicrobiaceae bacterium]|nr:type I secretion system permease/ATPase [Hyphomicrobiaceae bacterium]
MLRKADDAAAEGTPSGPEGGRFLLEALERIAVLLGHPADIGRIRASVPLEAGALPLERLEEAAAKVDLAIEEDACPPSRASALAAPFLAFSHAGDVRIVTELDAEQKMARVEVFADGGWRENVQALETLDADCREQVFYLARRGDGQEDTPHWFWSAAARFRSSYVQLVLAGFLVNILALASPLFIMNVYDRVIPNLTIPTLWALAIGVLIAIVFDFLLKMTRSSLVDETGRRIDMAVTGRIFDHLLALKPGGRSRSTGVLASHLRDFDTVRDVMTSSSVIAATDALFILLFLLVLYWLVGILVLVPLIAAVLVIAITYGVQWPMGRAMSRTQTDSARRHGILVETLLALDRIKSLGAAPQLRRRFDSAVAEASRSATASRFWSNVATTAVQTITQAVSVIIIVWGVFLVIDGNISVGALIAANILSGRVLAPLASIAATLQRLQQARYSYRSVDRLMAEPGEWGRAVATRALQSPALAVEGVRFGYEEDSLPALDAVSFSIAAGERLGIVGRIGSGKSTLLRLVAGLESLSTGRILIDGVDLAQVSPETLRRFVGHVPQEPELVSGTLLQNLTLGFPDAGPEDIERALELSGLAGWAKRHPLGLSLPIAERGRSLSGGQRQAIALAQTLIRRPRLLLLDEPTASQDSAAEMQLLSALERLSQNEGVTLIIATHRQSTLAIVSKLLVLEGGRLAAFGPRDKVLAALEAHAAGRSEAAGRGDAVPERP